MEEASHASGTADATRTGRSAGVAVRQQRTRPLVERRGQPHERCLPKDLLRATRAALPSGAASPLEQRRMNRRIRNRTYGGVGEQPVDDVDVVIMSARR